MGGTGKPPPDFAMVRAVEILAQIAEKQLASSRILSPPIDVPVILFNEHLMFVIGKTMRAKVVEALGAGYAFPAKGWETYAIRDGSARNLLSLLYNEDVLVGADYYVPRGNSVPELRPFSLGSFRLVPGQVAIGDDMTRLDERFTAVSEGPDARTYSHAFEVVYPGGVAYAQGTGGFIQRLVLYAIAA